MGGPKSLLDKYGSIRIPDAYKYLRIAAVERDLWLECMGRALRLQDYPESLIDYLLRQLYIPAGRIRQACMHG